jgi:hypothetical protein
MNKIHKLKFKNTQGCLTTEYIMDASPPVSLLASCYFYTLIHIPNTILTLGTSSLLHHSMQPSQSHVTTDGRSVSQSVSQSACLDVEPLSGLITRF